ncbi:MAG: transglycosylase SLT domain-containing protein, partial [Bacteroidales bacterium]|nr:transglycosylase SLT domain-containing protein [Bacteroidales bacterium]
MSIRTRNILKYILLSLVAFLVIPIVQETRIILDKFERSDLDSLKCAIALKAHDDTTRTALLAGYSYELLTLFAESEDIVMTIVQEQKGENYLDSVALGTADVIVLPYVDSMAHEDVMFSQPVDSLIVFGFTKSLLGIPLRAFNQWYEDFSASPEAASVHSRFFTTMAPQKRSTGGYLGPYDALIKKYAAQIGWDWRLFAALIYQESHFRIDVTSYRGAKGLLQMMPSTARRFGADDLFNPEE